MQDLHEGRQDAVMKTIQSELWPIAQKLERTLKSGQKVSMPDRDGSVLRDSQQKAIEIIQQYTGTNAHSHINAVNKATDYRQVQQILSNVLLKNMGHGTVKGSEVIKKQSGGATKQA